MMKITVLKTFYSNVKKMDYLLGRDEAGSLRLFKGYVKGPFRLAIKKDVFESAEGKIIHREYFDEFGNKIATK